MLITTKILLNILKEIHKFNPVISKFFINYFLRLRVLGNLAQIKRQAPHVLPFNLCSDSFK